MKAIEIRNKYLNFFQKHGHAVIPSAPLIPEKSVSDIFSCDSLFYYIHTLLQLFLSSSPPPIKKVRILQLQKLLLHKSKIEIVSINKTAHAIETVFLFY